MTGKLTSADFVPFTAVAVGSENVTAKVHVPPAVASVAFEQGSVAAGMAKSGMLSPVTLAGPSKAVLMVSGFVMVTVTGAETTPAIWVGKTSGFGEARIPTTFPLRKKKGSVNVDVTGAARHAAPPPLAHGPVTLTKFCPAGLPVTVVAASGPAPIYLLPVAGSV